MKRGRTTWGYYMPKYSFLKYGIEIRPNEHNHKGQMAHIHIYIHGEEVG